MPKFTPGEPIVTREPTILVEELEPGRHRFSLVVEDDRRQRSAPDEAVVIVQIRSGGPISGPGRPGGGNSG